MQINKKNIAMCAALLYINAEQWPKNIHGFNGIIATADIGNKHFICRYMAKPLKQMAQYCIKYSINETDPEHRSYLSEKTFMCNINPEQIENSLNAIIFNFFEEVQKLTDEKRWFITTYDKFEPVKSHDGAEILFYAMKSARTVGFCESFEEADKCVKSNAGDINETCYAYAVIEGISPGLYQYAEKNDRHFYKFDDATGTYKTIEEPKEAMHQCGFAIG